MSHRSLKKAIDVLFDLQFNIHTQLTKVHLKPRKRASALQDKEGNQRIHLPMAFSDALASVLGLPQNLSSSLEFTSQIVF